MLTIFVTTVTVLVLSLFALMAIVPFMLEVKLGRDVPDKVVQFDHKRREHSNADRPAA